MKEAGPFRKLAALGLGSLTVIAIASVVQLSTAWITLRLGGSHSLAESLMWFAGCFVVAWLCPVFYTSRAGYAIYSFWMRRIAGLEL